MRARSFLAVSLLVASCSYDFGGDTRDATSTGAGGAGATDGSASSTDVTSNASGLIDASSSVTASASGDASSSAGTGVLAPCLLAVNGMPFQEDFETPDPNARWKREGEGDGVTKIDPDGTARLELHTAAEIAFVRNDAIRFQDCYVDVRQTNVSDHQMDVIAIAKDDNKYFELRFLAGDPDPGTEVELRWGNGTPMADVAVLPDRRAPHVRLASEGPRVRAYLSEDGERWEQVFDGERQTWMDEPTTFALRLRRRDTQEGNNDDNAGANYDDVSLP